MHPLTERDDSFYSKWSRGSPGMAADAVLPFGNLRWQLFAAAQEQDTHGDSHLLKGVSASRWSAIQDATTIDAANGSWWISVIDSTDGRRRWVRETVGQAASELHNGEADAAVGTLAELTSSGGDTAIADCRAATSMLNTAAAEMINTLCRDTGGVSAFGVHLADEEGEEVAIDDIVPPIRAGIRALLANVNGDSETAEIQLDLAFRTSDPVTAGTITLHSLLWASDLVEQCEREHVRVPTWLGGHSPRS